MSKILWSLIVFCAFSAVFSITVLFGWWVWKLLSGQLSDYFKRKFSVAGYQCFYLTTDDLLKDSTSTRLLLEASKGYDKSSPLNDYYASLNDQRLPLTVFVNWARSIAEDVYCSHIPTVRVIQWSRYFESKNYVWFSRWGSDFPEYEEHEMAYLWGAVFYWLGVCIGLETTDAVMDAVARQGCKKHFAKPYFMHFYQPTCANDMPRHALPSNENTEDSKADGISRVDILKGFEQMNVTERCNARRLLNDLLPDCQAWKMILREMRLRGWFREQPPINIEKVEQMAMGDGAVLNKYGN